MFATGCMRSLKDPRHQQGPYSHVGFDLVQESLRMWKRVRQPRSRPHLVPRLTWSRDPIAAAKDWALQMTALIGFGQRKCGKPLQKHISDKTSDIRLLDIKLRA